MVADKDKDMRDFMGVSECEGRVGQSIGQRSAERERGKVGKLLHLFLCRKKN